MTQTEKHIWLIDALRRGGRVSLRELSQLWKNSIGLGEGKELKRGTLGRWREEIFSLYGLKIESEKCGSYRYYIANPEALGSNRIKQWMLDCIGVNNIIAENKNLSTRIVLEEIPSGRDFLSPILAAMRENRALSMTYQGFNRQALTFDIEPYCIKLHQSRWYLLGRGENGKLRIYCLDRIKKLMLTDKKFQLPGDFNARDYFSLHFGVVIHDGTKPCRIVLRAYDNHVNYMRTLPLHPTQQEIETEEGCYSDFQYYLAPTYDFVLAVLGMGSFVEVLKPLDLRNQMKGWIRELSHMYNDEE